jgi:hypothetical protein
MTHPALEVTYTHPVEVVAYWLKEILRVISSEDRWTRDALARDADGRPLESREAIHKDGVRFSLLGAIERYVPYDTHRMIIRVIVEKCQERGLPSNLTQINETVSQDVIVKVLEDAVWYVNHMMSEEQCEVLEFVKVPSGTPTVEEFEARVLELKELEQQSGTLWGDYTCGENITPSLLRMATLHKEILRPFLARCYGELMLSATTDQMQAATQALA